MSAPQGSNPALVESALPALRWPFRILGGLVAVLGVLILVFKAAEVWRGEVAFFDLLEADGGMLAAALAFALCFGVGALTGKVPAPIWKLFRRVFNSAA